MKKARIFSKKNSKSLDMKIKYIKTNESIEIPFSKKSLENEKINDRTFEVYGKEKYDIGIFKIYGYRR